MKKYNLTWAIIFTVMLLSVILGAIWWWCLIPAAILSMVFAFCYWWDFSHNKK